MSNNLNNIKAIKEMLDGSHHSQAKIGIGWDDHLGNENKIKKREIGEEWPEYDKDGKILHIWIQKDGYRIKKPPYYNILNKLKDFINSYPNCLPDCKTKPEDRTELDRKYNLKFGRCADCQFRIENKKKLNGEWKEYERQQMLENATSFFKQADIEIDLICKQLTSGIDFINSDGKEEKWVDKNNINLDIKREYNEYKKIILDNLIKTENE